ncbi:ferredoxin, partial [Streptomyces sp. NPDC051776]|uniref:ferredoxin n=1 Tax=Streptomyces sp. NPDC051776 TaxID=3155414 RepID=UPI0034181883
EAVRQVTQAVRGRGACQHPDGSVRFIQSALQAFTDDLAAHMLRGGCGRPTHGLLPLPVPGYEKGGITSGEKLAVDWTLCEGHGVCAELVPELIQIAHDGYPALADASVPIHLKRSAQRAVRRCPALALRLEAAPLEQIATATRRALPRGRG